MGMDDARIQLILDLGQSGKNVAEVRQELEKLDATSHKAGDGLAEVEKSAGKASRGTADFGRSALETGRIVQDFAQGGIGGIINNLEGFTRAIGLGPGAAGAMTLLGVAALTATPYIKAWWNEFSEGANKLPASTDSLKRLNDELESNKKRLGELKDQQVLTNTELAEFNRLTAESTRLEKEANAEKQRRVEADKARAQQTPEQSQLASDFSKISGGANYDKIVQSIGGLGDYNAKKAEYDRLSKAFMNGPPTPEEAARYQALSQDLNAFASTHDVNAIQAQNETLVNRARKGDVDAFNQIKAGATGGLRDQFDAIDPAKAGARAYNQQQATAAIKDAIGDVLQPLVTALKDRNAAAKQGIDQAKAIDAQQDEAAKEAEKLGKADAKAKAKGLADVQAAARNVVPPGMLPKQPFVDLTGSGDPQADIQALQAQAAGLANQMQAAAAQGLDVTPLATELQRVQSFASRLMQQQRDLQQQLYGVQNRPLVFRPGQPDMPANLDWGT